ncbi:NnrU family protein in cluster with Mesaconyl-CoA hydratase [Rubellimicrobium mesophilum DSM 19309]|uniref:NnrU family protein in cluster with Mesaconyl-CoA hydratase n=1 Tax=Rubellimicrobium mesophilum DSM 19309 TaxID=442562 RepID=A0A017HQ74_9RHOB|nr:NnrU family protein [Rubellimicrobium mesophilum]EYD76465.1 NnrU family protein in cluster with Mesaconyl-CoA hydratase [Rubellimicrobium mesophilum DSM 19309]
MVWLILGVLLWSGTHLWKRLAPESRARAGNGGRGIVALGSLLGVVLMVIGYRSWTSDAVWWGRTPATTGINNLLMLVAFYLAASSGMKTRAMRALRHPLLIGVMVWAVAHLLVNGDLPSFVLFGGLLVWAILEVVLINRAEPLWVRPAPAPLGKEIGAAVGAVVVLLVVGYIHGLVGPWPFGG